MPSDVDDVQPPIIGNRALRECESAAPKTRIADHDLDDVGATPLAALVNPYALRPLRDAEISANGDVVQQLQPHACEPLTLDAPRGLRIDADPRHQEEVAGAGAPEINASVHAFA